MIGSTLWILGTSVSIEDDGYATRLAASVQQRERQVRDLSVGAPAYAYARGTWADYGQSISDVPGNVAVFGNAVRADQHGASARKAPGRFLATARSWNVGRIERRRAAEANQRR